MKGGNLTRNGYPNRVHGYSAHESQSSVDVGDRFASFRIIPAGQKSGESIISAGQDDAQRVIWEGRVGIRDRYGIYAFPSQETSAGWRSGVFREDLGRKQEEINQR